MERDSGLCPVAGFIISEDDTSSITETYLVSFSFAKNEE
jgi:hypothetical protein